MENISLIFKEKKLKLTPQRLAVYQYLKSTTEHPSAETIYNGLQATYPTMSLATVYKTLKTLVENTEYKVHWNKIFFYGLCKECQ